MLAAFAVITQEFNTGFNITSVFAYLIISGLVIHVLVIRHA